MTTIEMIEMMKGILDQCVTGDILKDSAAMVYEIETFCDDAREDGINFREVAYMRNALEDYADSLL